MGIIELSFIAVGLAMDAFAVSLGAGTTSFGRGPRATFRLAFHFGLFQALMPLIGWLAGSALAGAIASLDHWVAFGLLGFIGIRMIRSGLNPEAAPPKDPSRGLTLVLLSIATSIDALAVGLSLAVLDIKIWLPCAVIGVITAALSIAGIQLGNRLGASFGHKMEILGGLILISIGLKILITGQA